jgi:hypothetical protein
MRIVDLRYMTATWTVLIAALSSLSGVALGSFLEPIKLAAARRTRIQERITELCAQLIDTATMTRSRSLLINQLHRRITHGDHQVSDEDLRTADAAYWNTRTELRRAAMLLQLFATADVAEQAMIVRHSDYRLRRIRMEGSDHIDKVPEAVIRASNDLDTAVLRFIELARSHTTR